MNQSLEFRAEEEIRRVLERGEGLLWSGISKQGLILRSSDAYLIPFSLMWGGFAIFWEVGVLKSGGAGFFALFGIPFVLIGLYLIIGRFFVDAYMRGRTYYGLTNRRAIIISGFASKTTTSLGLRGLYDITLQEKSDGSGTILLARPAPNSSWGAGTGWPGASSTPAFDLIQQAAAVHRKILSAQKAVA